MSKIPTIRFDFRKVLMPMVGVCLAILIGEIIVRATGIGNVYPYIVVSETLRKRRPFSDFVNRKENVNLVEINNLGFHDYNRDNHNERYRILVLGDSFVEGAQVSLSDLFTSRLEN